MIWIFTYNPLLETKLANVFYNLPSMKQLFIVHAAYYERLHAEGKDHRQSVFIRLGKVSLPVATGQKLTGAWDKQCP